MANVREAVASDLPAIVQLGIAMHAESPRFSGMDYDTGKVGDLLAGLHASPFGLVLVAESQGQIVGMVLALVMESFFGRSLTASELVVYVAPEHRGGSAAAKLVKALESWAAAKGAHELVLGVSTGVHAERTAEFYGRLGFASSGYMVRKTF